MDGSHHVCPYCNGPYAPPALKADLDRNYIGVEGKQIKAPPKVVEMFSIMADAHPVGVTRERLVAKMWGAGGGPESETIISVYMLKLREALKGTDWTVTKFRLGKYQLLRK